jgi:arsenite-transporting ATPase
MSRLVLVTGAGGAGVSTIAAATTAASADEGLTTRLLSVDSPGPVHPAVAEILGAAVGQVSLGLGADPVVAEAWSRLPEVRLLSTLTRAAEAVAEVDLVVIDAGPSATARDLVSMPDMLVRLLDAALTPRMAMVRAADGSPAVFEALSAARTQALSLQQVLHRPTTTLRLVVTPTDHGIDHLRRWFGLFALMGIGVDGIIVNRYPRKSDEGAVAVDGADAHLARAAADTGGVAVWKSTSRLRPVPKGASVLGPLGRVAVLDADQLTVHVGDEDFHLELPLAGRACLDATVGIDGDRLVLALGDDCRWLDLPPVLRRCQPLQAVRTAEGLRIEFAPDPATWMQGQREETT